MNRQKIIDVLAITGWTIAVVITVAGVCLAVYSVGLFSTQVANAVAIVNAQGTMAAVLWFW